LNLNSPLPTLLYTLHVARVGPQFFVRKRQVVSGHGHGCFGVKPRPLSRPPRGVDQQDPTVPQRSIAQVVGHVL